MTHCVTLQPPLDLNFCPFFSYILFYLRVGGRVQGQRADGKGRRSEWDHDTWCKRLIYKHFKNASSTLIYWEDIFIPVPLDMSVSNTKGMIKFILHFPAGRM